MKRLAFALMTGVGLFLHKEWKKRQQLTLSESRYRQDEKQFYAHFKFLLDRGYELDESRTAYSYKLEFQRDDHFLIFLMKHPNNLSSYLITPAGEELRLEEVFRKDGSEFLGPELYARYDDFLRVLANKVEALVDGDFISNV